MLVSRWTCDGRFGLECTGRFGWIPQVECSHVPHAAFPWLGTANARLLRPMKGRHARCSLPSVTLMSCILVDFGLTQAGHTAPHGNGAVNIVLLASGQSVFTRPMMLVDESRQEPERGRRRGNAHERSQEMIRKAERPTIFAISSVAHRHNAL